MAEPYTLIIGEKNYSSWSMRAWLALRLIDVPFALTEVSLYRADSRQLVRGMGGETGLVPVLRSGSLVIWDTLAIIEFLDERHGGLWPEAEADRALARSYVCEVHSGMTALRSAMPVNTRGRNRKAMIDAAVSEDILRMQALFERTSATKDGWMFQSFGAVDIVFSAIATRFQTYGVVLSAEAMAYMKRVLEHPLVKEWLAFGVAEDSHIDQFELPIHAE
ncbi:MAG: glutathione S-transferase [Pseudomonadota bacterium]